MGIRTTGIDTRWLYLFGGLLLLLGTVHLAAAPETLRAVPPEVPAEFKSAFLFMFCAAGLAVLLSGALVLWSAYGLARQWRGFWTLALLSGFVIVLMGVGAVLLMPRHPFAYLLLGLGLSVLPPLLLPLRKRRRPGDVLNFRREEPDRRRTLH
jgi:lysylphosphatidylglycerol synthetase-like protein (DUF2156 family)